MRIAFVTGAFPSISETFIARQARGLVRLGVDVRLLAVRPGLGRVAGGADELSGRVRYRSATPRSRLARLGMEVFHLVRRPFRLGLMFRVWRAGRADPHACAVTYLSLAHALLSNPPADLVHAQFGGLGRVAARLKELGVFRKPLVVSFRGGDTTKVLPGQREFYQIVYRQAAFVLPVCRYLAELHRAAGCPEDKIRVVVSGLELGEYAFHPAEPPGDRPCRVLMMGRLVGKKGFRYGLEALDILARQGVAIHCTLVGDGPLRMALEKQAGGIPPPARVHFAGALSAPEAKRAIQSADIVLVPSVRAEDGDQEGIPNVLKEAMALGRPVIASRHAGIPELVVDGVNGTLVPEEDGPAMAKALHNLMSQPAGSWSDRIARARLRVEEDFDNPRVCERLSALYHALQ